MQRFFGMMPASEVERRESFLDKYDTRVMIDAGPNGWTVRYCDGSSQYKDETKTTDENFQTAYEVANEAVGPLRPMPKEEERYDVMSESCCDEVVEEG